jgi:alpha-mannosidase
LRAGYELNVPLRAVPAGVHAGAMPREGSFVQVDARNVIVEVVKQAEEDDDLIVRLYECEHASAQATVRFGFPVRSACVVDLMEEGAVPLGLDGDEVDVTFRPFEIVTLRVSAG